jgi:phospholipid/cholesterol/gamma-HCH transport system substrate-binding protein
MAQGTAANAVKVGLFVLLVGAAAFVIYRFVSPPGAGGNGYTVHAFFPDATGLATRSRVTIAGIAVGSIRSIKLERGKARIDVLINPDVDLYDNATIGKKSASLLGESLLVLTPGTPDHRKLHDGDEITIIVNETTPGEIMDEVKEIADSVKAVAQQLAASIGTEQGGRNIKLILQNLADATDSLNGTIRENREVIRETLQNVDAITRNANPQIAQILENVRQVTGDVRQMMSAVESKEGGKGELRDTIEHIDRASKSLESALEHIDSVAGRIDRGEGTVGKLTKDDALVNEVQGVAEGVNDYVQNLTRLQTVVGLRSDYLFLANAIKSYVSLRLVPNEDKYYEIELINDPKGLTSITDQTVNTQNNPNLPPSYRTITYTTTNSFRFSLQFAKRLGPFTGRFGIKESTGGVGLDVHLLQDRFEIVNDLFGFSEEIQPRYRVYISYEFLKHLWLYGGIDHVTAPDQRDYFLGLQLRYTDEDLKTILPFSGGAAAVAK